MDKSKKRILVTGGAGFMGSHLVDFLTKNNEHEVFAVDDLSGGYIENVSAKAHFTKLDLRDRRKVEQYIAKVKPELLYYLAADASEGRSQFTPLSSTERNYLAYMNTLVSCIKHGLKKVVLTSSMSVYGAQEPGDDWQTFQEVFDEAYAEFAAISATKPLALLEFGAHENNKKPAWIAQALESISSGRYPRVKAISYWHSNWENDDGTTSRLRLDSSKESLQAYQQAIQNPLFVTEPVFE